MSKEEKELCLEKDKLRKRKERLLKKEEQKTIEEPVKDFLSFLWLLSGVFATSTSLALTHEKVPDTAPLPDLVLDNIR